MSAVGVNPGHHKSEEECSDVDVCSRAMAFMARNDHANAEPLLSYMYGKGVRTAEVLYALGVIAASRNDLGSARQLFDATLAKQAKHTNAHFYLGKIAVLLGNVGDAKREFQKALDITPDHQAAKLHLNEMIQNRSGAENQRPLPFETSVPELKDVTAFKARVLAKHRALYWLSWSAMPLPMKIISGALLSAAALGIATIFYRLASAEGAADVHSRYQNQAAERSTAAHNARSEAMQEFQAKIDADKKLWLAERERENADSLRKWQENNNQRSQASRAQFQQTVKAMEHRIGW